MPDFDKDLRPVIKDTSSPDFKVDARGVQNTPMPAGPGSLTPNLSETPSVFDKLNKYASQSPNGMIRPFVTDAELSANKRYATYNPTLDNQEDFAAYGQSWLDKAVNGTLKGTNLAATTVAGGFGALGGLLASPFTQKLSTIWDNPVMNALDKWNETVDNELLPNYYKDIEKDASWYSTDNWFTPNFLFDKLIKNAGFAVGAMYGGNIANAGLLRAGLGLGETLLEAANISGKVAKTLQSTSNVSKVSKLASQAFTKFTPFLKNAARAVSVSENAKAYEILASKLGNIAELEANSAALGESVANSAFGELAKSANKFNKFNDSARRTAIAAYSSGGEAAFEALQTSKEIRNNLIDEYKQSHGGLEPEGVDLEEVNNRASQVGRASFLGNLAILGFTEYLQLPKLLGSSYSSSRQVATSLAGRVDDVARREGVWGLADLGPTTKFGKLYDKVTGVGKYIFDPKEAAQEGLQYAMQVGSQNYYNKAYRTNDADFLIDGVLYGLYGKDEKGKGVGALNSKEGIEGMLLGGLTGGPMQAMSTYREGKATAANTQAFIKEISNAKEFKDAFVDKTNSINRAIVLQQQHQNAVMRGDKLEAKDLQADEMHNYLAPRIKYGRFDMVKEDINDLRKMSMTDQGLADLKNQGIGNINDTVQSFQKRLNEFEKVAMYTNELYRSTSLIYAGQTNEDGSQKYSDDVIDKMVYAASKIADYDVRIPEVNSKLIDYSIATQEVLDLMFNQGKTNRQATKDALVKVNALTEKIDGLDTLKTIKDELKTQLSDVMELSARRKLYLSEYDEMVTNPDYFTLLDSKKIPDFAGVRQPIVNDAGKTIYKVKSLEVGKEYSLAQGFLRVGNKLTLAPKLKVLSKTLGGEFEVQTPNGDIEFMTPFQFKKYKLSDVSNDSPKVAEILDKVILSVSRKAKFKALNIKDQLNKLEYINSLDNQKLSDEVERLFNEQFAKYAEEMAKSAYKREQLIINGGKIENDQNNFSGNSGEDPTGNEPDEDIDPELLRKPDWNLFKSITVPSRFSKQLKGKGLPDFVTRYNVFINNVKNFKNTGDIRIMLVPGKFQEQYGLKGLIETGYEGKSITDEMLNNVDEGFIAAVFVEQKNGNTYLIDKDGNRIKDNTGKDVIVGQPGADISKVVFATMPSTSLFWKEFEDGKTPRFRVGEEESATAFKEGWKDYRNILLNTPFDPKGSITTFSFGISKGFPEKVKGKIQRNKIGEVLGISDQTIAETGNIIQISTLGGIAHTDGQTYKYAKGRPVLKFADVLEYLQNANFTDNQAKTIFQVLRKFSELVQSNIANNQNIQLKNQYTEFLQNVLFWKKSDKPARNQIFLDEKTGKLNIGTKQYDLIDIADQEKEIINDLKDVYLSVNNTTLKSSDKFYEFVFVNDQLIEVTWPNYQSYLLAANNPDGSNRETPLTINVTPPSAAVPYAYEQKYAYMDLEFNMPVAPAPGVNVTPSSAPTGSTPIVPLTYESSNEDIIKARMSTVIAARIQSGLFGEVNAGDGIIRNQPTSEGYLIFIVDDNSNIIIRPSEGLDKLIANNDKVNKMREDLGLTPAASQTPGGSNPPPPQSSASDIEKRRKGEDDRNNYPGIKELISVYNGDKLFFNIDASAFEVSESLKSNNVTADDIFNIRNTISGKLGDWFERGFEQLSGKTYKQYDAELSTLQGNQQSQQNPPPVVSVPNITKVGDHTIIEDNGVFSVSDNRPNGEGKGIIADNIKTYNEAFTILQEDIKDIKNINKNTSPPSTGKKTRIPDKNSFGNNRKVSPLDKQTSRITEEEIEFFKSWVAKNVPNMEYQFLQNMIKVRGGGEAWGKHVNGVISIVRRAVKGTEYHEVYEYVEKGFLTPEEITALNNEFRAKSGTFVDRESGKTYAYNDPTVTDLMIKERRADDFADFMAGKLPAKTFSEKLRRLFKAIMDFFSFAKNRSLQDKLFRDIASAKFADQVFPESRKDDIEEYKRVAGISASEAFEYVQDIKARFFQGIIATNASLFDMSEKNANNIFNVVAEDYLDAEDPLTETQLQDLIQLTKESLRSSNIEFSESGEMTINDENVSSRNYAADAFSVNFKKSSPYAVKLLSSSSIRMKKRKVKGEIEYAPSPITGGMQLIPYGEVYITLADKLANTLDVDDVIAKLYDLARSNNDYVQIFRRLGGNMDTGKIDFNNYKSPDNYRLLVSFMSVYTKQRPEILIQYLNNNDRYVGTASYSKASQAVENKWVNDIILNAGKEGSIVVYQNKQYELKEGAAALIKDNTTENRISLLKSLGIDFDKRTYDKLSKDQRNDFSEAVQQVIADITSEKVLSFKKDKGKSQRSIGSGLKVLAEIYAKVNSVNYDSTTINSEGNLQQVFTDSNAPSLFEYYFNSVKTDEELFQKMPQLKDVFSKNSVVLARGGAFFDSNGNRKKAQLNVKVNDGEIDLIKEKGQSITDFNIGTRTISEINQNVKGNYYVLIPADGSKEWMLNLGNTISYAQFKTGRWKNDIQTIFSGYLIDDIKLAKDSNNRDYLNNMKGREKQLRFFEDFLKGTTMLGDINKMIADENITDEEIKKYVDSQSIQVREAVLKYIEKVTEKSINSLQQSNDIIDLGEDTFSFKGIARNKEIDINNNNISSTELTAFMNFVNTNYVINNIEMHKVLFGDPFQFATKIKTKNGRTKITLDITKRIKSFLSPRRLSINFPELNNFYTNYRNTVNGIKLTPNDIGYHAYKDFLNTATISDINIAGTLYGKDILSNEADAQSWLFPTAYREIKDKNGQWSTEAEAFHNWQMAYARQKLSAKGKYDYKKNTALKSYDAELIKKDCPSYYVEALKPIVSGSKFGKNYIDLVLDKFSQFSLYYEAIEDTALEDLFVKMFNENIDYVVVESGRKTGAQELHSLYKGGKLNPKKFSKNSIVKVSWESYGIQVENSYNAGQGTTLGSQPTKIATMDMFDNGKPISEKAETAVKEHTEALSMMYDNGVKRFMRDLGIIDLGNRYVINDKNIVSKRLREEMLKRELSENVLASITINESTNDFDIPFESSTNYIEIKRILYSMITNRITSPKVNGVSSVQVAATMWENSAEGRSLARKIDGVYEKISQKGYEALSDKEKGEVVLTDNTLKMYDDGYCEILVPFPSHLKGLFKGKTEKEVFDIVSKELGDALTGIGFRIPTQALNSIERLKIVGFLPEFMGKTVVVPAEITTKAGSDFDIDKLNMYLKSLYRDAEGKLKMFQWKGSEIATREFYSDVFDSVINTKEINLYNQLAEAASNDMFGTEFEQNLYDRLAKVQKKRSTKEEFVNDAYTRALENRYYYAIDGLLGLEENFERLTAINTNKDLVDLADTIDEILKDNESAISNRTLDRNYMTSLRHSFLTGKAWVGRVALHITGHSNGQKAGLFVDDEDFTLTLPHNINDKGMISVSGLKDSKDNYISDNLSQYINAIVDIAKDPYIIKIIYSSEIVDVMMFFARAGVSIEDAAMFVQQPIIKEFVKNADNNKKRLSSLIVNPTALEKAFDNFPASAVAKQKVGYTYNVENLRKNIEDYNGAEEDSLDKLSDEQNAEQQFIFNEFVQALKAANGLSELTQATTFDTTSFASSEQLGLKQYKAENQMIATDPTVIKISSVKAVLENTHLGNLERALDKSNNALGTLLLFNSEAFREYINELLELYNKNKYLSKKNRELISEKLSASLLDYIIQSKKNMLVGELTKGEKSAASLLIKAKSKYLKLAQLEEASSSYQQVFEPQILQDLEIIPGARKGAPETIRLSTKLESAAEVNMYTDMMRGLRDDPNTSELYDALLRIAIVQGTYRTSVSIKNIIPIEDYARVVTDLVKGITLDESFNAFKDNLLFQRNNFKDSTIVPRIDLYAKIDEYSLRFNSSTGEESYDYTLPSIINSQLGRSVIKISKRTKGAGAELIVVPRIIESNGDSIDFQTGQVITPRQFAEAAKQDDNPFTYVYGYQLVKINGKPLMGVNSKGKPTNEYIYKLVNLYGDGKFTFEYPTNGSKSLLENGTAKISTEFTNEEVYAMLSGKLEELPNVQSQSTQPLPSDPKGLDPFTPTSNVEPKGEKVKEGIYVNQEALTKDKQLELFEYLKPFLEAQGKRTNVSPNAPIMIGLGLRWDYKKNNSEKTSVNVGKNLAGYNTAYAYYDLSIDGKPLGKITPRFVELMNKTTGVDISNYDGAIVNIYTNNSFISNHSDLEESETAEKYPVVVANIGGSGNIILGTDANKISKDLKSGAGYLFGYEGKNRKIPHSTYASDVKGFLPSITVSQEGKTFSEGSYRVSITMRRVMPLEPGMPTSPLIKSSTQVQSNEVKKGVEISSNAKGLAAALTNPTELAKSKGNLTESYPVNFNGKTYRDAEAAYQALKSTATKDEGPNSTYNLMVKIIKAKLEQHPRLVSEITKQGGSAWILSSTHQPTKQNSVWETGGKNWFIKSLNDAYLSIQQSNEDNETEQLDNIVAYGGKNFIVEGSFESGNATVFFTKGDGTKGAELTSDKPLFRKVSVATYAQDNPDNVVELTDLKGSPKYLFIDSTKKVVSLNPTSYGDEIVSEDVINRVNTLMNYFKGGININPGGSSKDTTRSPKFSYKGKTINTAFDLTKGQVTALETLSDFVKNKNGDKFITLQGPAGTGKTSVIGYLQNYLGSAYTFHYMAPTHAATAELAFATVKTGNKTLPATVASSFSKKTNGLTKKLIRKLALRNNVIVIDEVSMLNSELFNLVKNSIDGDVIKVIFMGDELQIPEVTDETVTEKQVNKAFSEFEQVKLTEVKRTSDDNILKVLNTIRYNINNKIPKIPNTNVLKYLKNTQFNLKLAESIETNPEDTMVIAFTNKTVKEHNERIRKELGRVGNLQKDDVIIGYLGYSSKQIENSDIANSLQYTVKSVKKNGSMYNITATSKKLDNLRKLGVENISEEFTTGYYQLSPNDTFVFDDITIVDMEANNAKVSTLMKSVYDAKVRAQKNFKDWYKFYDIVSDVSREMSRIDLGDNYIYNPITNRMEKYEKDKHKALKKEYAEIYVEKGIGLGHAVTVHKSQGATFKHVFFDANSLPEGAVSILYNGDRVVGMEKHSLIYVGMSRASDTLTVSDDNSENFYNLDGSPLEQEPFDLANTSDTNSIESTENYMNLEGEIYEYSEINPDMLEHLGYSPEAIGKIMKKVNGC